MKPEACNIGLVPSSRPLDRNQNWDGTGVRRLRSDAQDFESPWKMRIGAESDQREIAASRTFCAQYAPITVSSVAAAQIDQPRTRANEVGQRSHSGSGPHTEPLSRIDQPHKKNRTTVAGGVIKMAKAYRREILKHIAPAARAAAQAPATIVHNAIPISSMAIPNAENSRTRCGIRR